VKNFRLLALVLGIGLLLGGVAVDRGLPSLDLPILQWFWPQQPLDLVIAVYESENQPLAEVSVLGGQTANVLRKADKWRQFDKDRLPAAWKPALDAALERTKPPCLCFVRGGKIVAAESLPKSDEALAAAIARRGGIQCQN